MYRAPTPREGARWHALWLLARGCSAAQVAKARERDPHTIGDWLARFCRRGAAALAFEPTGGSPALNGPQQAELKAAVQAPPRAVGIEAANWS
jgi:transposase